MLEQQQKEWAPGALVHPGKRYQGQFLDGLVTIMIFFAVMMVTRSLEFTGLWSNLIIIGLPFSYFVFSDALPNGQSLGKIPIGICVVSKTTGKPCTVFQSFARNVLTPVLGVVDAILILGEKRQRLGDRFANTIVIHRT